MDSRTLARDVTDLPIQCVTVHKAKGLEYGHVILPFCSFPIDLIKQSRLHISTDRTDGNLKIGYSINFGEGGRPFQNMFYNESLEKSEMSREEARILYVAMTRSIRSFSWIDFPRRRDLSWQALIKTEV